MKHKKIRIVMLSQPTASDLQVAFPNVTEKKDREENSGRHVTIVFSP